MMRCRVREKEKGIEVRKRNVQEGICERGADDLVDVRIRDTRYEVWMLEPGDGMGGLQTE
jgi:hypothetical protein